MNNNIIVGEYGDEIGYQADLEKYLKAVLHDQINNGNWEYAKDTVDLLQELETHNTPNLLVISENNGMGWTIKEYTPEVTRETTFTSLDKPLGKGYLILSLKATYLELVGKLGEPKCGGSTDGKTRVEWHIRLNNAHNTEFSIYDWKEDIPVTEVTRWHIGGTDKDTPYVRDFLFNEKHFEEL